MSASLLIVHIGAGDERRPGLGSSEEPKKGKGGNGFSMPPSVVSFCKFDLGDVHLFQQAARALQLRLFLQERA